MDFAGIEGTWGRGVPSGAEGARRGPEAEREAAGEPARVAQAGGGEPGRGWAGMESTRHGDDGSGPRGEGMRVDLALVKQEVLDWPEVEEGVFHSQWVKQEVEDGPEVKEEKPDLLELKQEVGDSWIVKQEKVDDIEVKEEKVNVKQEVMDWLDVKEERMDYLEIKQEEVFLDLNIKKEEMIDEAYVKEEPWVLKKEEEMDNAEVKEEELPTNLQMGSKRKLAMSRCETCGTEEAKYRCPRCMRYSCSLPCVKRHKTELTCSGVRDKTAFVSIQQFTEMNLLSDYRFLEDVARTADHISRDVVLKRPVSNKHMCFLKNRARRQGINLKLLPSGFTKRKENSTCFNKKKQQFCWHVKLQFPQSQAVYVEKRVPEDKTINEILRPYIDPEKSDPVIRQRLKVYIRSQTRVQIFMKVESMQQNLERYYELDPYKSLLDSLKNKVIIEYPTLHVVLKEFSSGFTVLHQVRSESTKNISSKN